MAKQTINIGAAPNNNLGDTLRDAGDKINDNFTELYTVTAGLGTASTLAFDTNGSLTANSDTKIPTQKAVKKYVDDAVTGAATISYVDSKLAGLSWKQAVRAATTANGTLSTAYENGDTIDGVTLTTGDRILIKNQSTASQNGIYIVNASGAPTRATDADVGTEMVNATVYVSEGTTNADTQWTCSTNGPITIGSTSLAFAMVSSGLTYSADDSTLDLSGSVFSVKNLGVGTAKLADAAVTLAKIANASANSRLLGSGASGSGASYGEITLGSGLSMSGTTLALSGVALTGAVTASGLTQSSARMLGRSTAGTGAIEEIAVGTGLSLSSGTLSVTAVASGSITGSGYTQTTARLLGRTTASTGAIEEITMGAGLTLTSGSLATSDAYTSTGHTMSTARLLGRTTASTGAAEEISVGSGLTLASGVLSATGFTMSTARILGRTTASTGAAEEISVGSGLNLASGVLSATGFTMATARLLGRTTLSTGAAEEITVGSGLTLATGSIALTVTSDTDGTLAANSDTKFPTQKATKTYVDTGLAAKASITYVDNLLAGLSWKQGARVATTANGTLATAFANGQTIDGVTLITADRILIKNQSAASENGIYIVAASGAPTRATDADSSAELVNASIYVSEGTTNADTQWTCTTNAPITVGSTNLAFAQLTSGGVPAGSITTSGLTQATARILGRTTGSSGAIEELTVGTGLTLGSGSLILTAVAYTASVFTMATARLLGRTTASTGAAEELTVGAGLTLASGSLATSGAYTAAGFTMATARLLGRTTASTGAAEEISVGTGLTFSSGSISVNQSAVKPTESLIVAAGDETTAITTGTAKVTFRMPYAFTLSAVRASLTTAQSSGSILTVDINEAGSTILSTKLTIDNSEKTSTTAATAAVISDTSLADDAEITIDVDQAGTGGAGLKVYLIGNRT